MSPSLLESANGILILLDIFLFFSLIALIIYSLTKRRHSLLKLSVLYLINQVALTVLSENFAWRVLLTTQGPGGNSELAAMGLLRKFAMKIFYEYIGYSILICSLLLVFNFFYQKFIFKITNKRVIQLFVIDLVIMLFISFFYAFYYYYMIGHKIEREFEWYNHSH